MLISDRAEGLEPPPRQKVIRALSPNKPNTFIHCEIFNTLEGNLKYVGSVKKCLLEN